MLVMKRLVCGVYKLTNVMKLDKKCSAIAVNSMRHASVPTTQSSNLSGRVAIVTAGTKGIGLAIARRLAENGAKVVVSSRKQEKVDDAVALLQSEGHQVSGMACNFGEEEDRKKLVSDVISSHGDVNILVQNAGVNPHMLDILSTSESALDKMYDVHIKGNFRMVQELFPHMKKSAKPCSIVLTSTAVVYVPMAFPGAYAITKSAVNTMVRAFAPDLDKHNIRINCLVLGPFDTDFLESFKSTKEWEKCDRFTLMRRSGEPHEAAGLAAFLASDDASFITGENYVVGGGFSTRT